MIVRTLLFTIFVPGSVTVLVPRMLLRSDMEYPLPLGVVRFAGAVIIVVGVAIYLWCAWNFIAAGHGTPNPLDAPQQLVVRGLYQFTRNPMYVGVGSIVAGEGVLFESATLLAYVTLLMLLFHLRVLTYEEPTLRRQFGAAFDAYCRRVPRWLPNLHSQEGPLQ
ncbi:MAG: isoprenylcysteine carboxylmethyltransferase family protein [Deltaproteobacteria bacterium]|nr:isoprenylcysteine carboxylmethyltransferase family protein [Deltaproteobacteria bacterium]MBI3387614.1 isoprenylcysteine carboxylmethyltransferase family protein [Deltaproteobacteria bacterium]